MWGTVNQDQSVIPITTMKLKQLIATAALLLIASAASLQAGNPIVPAHRPTELTLLPGQPAVTQYRPDKGGIVYMSDRSGAYTYMPLRAIPQNTQSQRLDILERKETLGYEAAKKVAIVNVRFDAGANVWRVEYVDNTGANILTSAHPVVVAKQ